MVAPSSPSVVLLLFWSAISLLYPATRPCLAWTALPLKQQQPRTRRRNSSSHWIASVPRQMRQSDTNSQVNDGLKDLRSSLNNDIAVPTILGPNGRPLRVTWEVSVARDILQRAENSSKRPYMVAVAGIPGSGKSSSAEILSHLINQETDGICVCLPADGYHYSKERLQQLELETGDETLIYRRGAPDTFDVTALLRDLQRIRQAEEDVEVKLPGFDHAVGDPTPDQHVYSPSKHSIVLMEGLYLLHDQHDWQEVQQYFDYTIYIQTSSVDESMARVKERNVCIPGYTPEEIYARVDAVDRRNAMLIEASSPSRASLVIGKNHGSPIKEDKVHLEN